MNLKVYDRTLLRSSGRNASPRITINKMGQFIINKAAAEMIGMRGDKVGIQIAQDESNPRNWYVKASEEVNAFKARLTKISYVFNAKSLYLKIIESMKADDTVTYRLPIGSDPTDGWYPIITAAIKRQR